MYTGSWCHLTLIFSHHFPFKHLSFYTPLITRGFVGHPKSYLVFPLIFSTTLLTFIFLYGLNTLRGIRTNLPFIKDILRFFQEFSHWVGNWNYFILFFSFDLVFVCLPFFFTCNLKFI